MAALQALGDPQRRLAWLVERARHRPPFPAEHRTEANRIHGCQARVWLRRRRVGGLWSFELDSDAATLKALGGLLCELASGQSASEPPNLDLQSLGRLDILRNLAPSRRATVLRIADQICRGDEACEPTDAGPSTAPR